MFLLALLTSSLWHWVPSLGSQVYFADNAPVVPGYVTIWQVDTSAPPGQQISSYYEDLGQVAYNFVGGGVVCGDGNYYAPGTNLNDNIFLVAPINGGSDPTNASSVPAQYNYFNLWCHPTIQGAILGVAYVGNGFGLVIYSPGSDPAEKVIGNFDASGQTGTGTAFSLTPDGSEVWGAFPSKGDAPTQTVQVLNVQTGQTTATYSLKGLAEGAPYVFFPLGPAKEGLVTTGAWMRYGGFEPSELYCAPFTIEGNTMTFLSSDSVACPQLWSSSQPGRDCGDGLYTFMANGASKNAAITAVNMTTLTVINSLSVTQAAPGVSPDPGALAC